jgi:CubicO group peptidase (beta-lactamase class C family)
MAIGELVADPAEVGMSGELLRRIERLLAEDVAAGLIPGASVAVARAGKLVYSSCVGFLDRPSEVRMPHDAIFRVYSMSKPFLSVAALSLVADGRLALDAPVSRYLPALADPQVAVPRGDRLEFVPAQREPTVLDLLRHTSGYSGGVYDAPPVAALYAERGVHKYDHTPAAFSESLDDLVEKLAELPLSFQPGTRWEYGRSGDVLGKVLEVAGGRSLDEVFRERVFDPLDMPDSGFWVEPEAADRMAEPLRTDGSRTPDDLIRVTRKPRFLSGGSGCVSTVDDFMRFCFALRGGGELDGRRVLPRALADMMVSDQIGPLAGEDPDFFPGGGYGFGFGLAVRTSSDATTPGSIGDYYWLARSSSSFFVDPQEELVGVLLMQRFWLPRHYQRWFKTLVYAALTG